MLQTRNDPVPPMEPEPVCARYCSQRCRRDHAAAVPAHLITRNSTMSLAIGVLITFLVVILVLYLVNMLPVDGRTRQIIRVIVIIIGVLSLLRYLGVGF
jgi:hypothetical protein